MSTSTALKVHSDILDTDAMNWPDLKNWAETAAKLLAVGSAELERGSEVLGRRDQYREAKLAYFKNRSRELDNFVSAVLVFLDSDNSDTKKIDDLLDYVIAHYEGESRPRF